MHIAREVYAADDDLASVRHSLPLAARFVALTKRRGEHLLWAGCRHPSGCGRFWLGASEGRWTSPRRASWAIAHGHLGRGQGGNGGPDGQRGGDVVIRGGDGAPAGR